MLSGKGRRKQPQQLGRKRTKQPAICLWRLFSFSGSLPNSLALFGIAHNAQRALCLDGWDTQRTPQSISLLRGQIQFAKHQCPSFEHGVNLESSKDGVWFLFRKAHNVFYNTCLS